MSKSKIQDWLVTIYDKKDNVKKAFIIKDRTEHEAEKETTFDVSKAHDWSMVRVKEELKRFCKEWGQEDQEIATNLGFDVKDDGFSELVINHDYIWVELHKVWIPENSRLYDKRDDVIVEYIKQKKTEW